MTGRLGDAEKAEDVTSETFESVLATSAPTGPAPTSRRGRSPSPTPGSQTISGAGSRRREVELDETVHPATMAGVAPCPGPLPAVAGPEEAVLAAEQRAEVAGAFRRLRADQQEVLALRAPGGLSAAQVAEVLGKSEGAARVAQHRALRRSASDGGDGRMTEPRDKSPCAPTTTGRPGLNRPGPRRADRWTRPLGR